MKKMFVRAMVLLFLITPGLADDKLRLSQEDAKQLHAFMLTTELLDFGDRAQSASAYLMAAELMLDYPTGDLAKARILELCGQARRLFDDDPFLKSWVDRLELRAGKTSRDLSPRFVVREGTLAGGQSVEFQGDFEAAWLAGKGLELQLLEADGRLVRRGMVLADDGVQPSQRYWRLKNRGEAAVDYRVLFRKP